MMPCYWEPLSALTVREGQKIFSFLCGNDNWIPGIGGLWLVQLLPGIESIVLHCPPAGFYGVKHDFGSG